ncbi:UNVERIFIED_CONTAM: hypothetical protein PYX00_000709 [Menopon gallinae]|uniref:Small ribosomal subunit protein bS16m n=1 Tax=Menopon gallinae TaxID=328185 RepID=A0AAW2IBL0_9NEOP
MEAVLKLVFPSSSGCGVYQKDTLKIIRFIRQGCANRPFFHISVQEANEPVHGQVIEQVGHFDPFPNQYNEKLAGLNFERIQHWLDQGAILSTNVKRLLGLAGYHPIHPSSFRAAWIQRQLILSNLKELEELKAKKDAESSQSSNES